MTYLDEITEKIRLAVPREALPSEDDTSSRFRTLQCSYWPGRCRNAA
jgi:hypothetical protein